MSYNTNCKHNAVTRLKLFHISYRQNFLYAIHTLPGVILRLDAAGTRQLASHGVFDNRITLRHAKYRPFGSGADQSLLDSPHRGPVMRKFFLILFAWTNCWTNIWCAGDSVIPDATGLNVQHECDRMFITCRQLCKMYALFSSPTQRSDAFLHFLMLKLL